MNGLFGFTHQALIAVGDDCIKSTYGNDNDGYGRGQVDQRSGDNLEHVVGKGGFAAGRVESFFTDNAAGGIIWFEAWIKCNPGFQVGILKRCGQAKSHRTKDSQCQKSSDDDFDVFSHITFLGQL